jgi:serine/threonine protein phosphatase 1
LLFNRFKSRAVVGIPATAPGERIYAIGDIHGRHDLLVELLERIGDHGRSLETKAKTHLILLGDMVDRGPDSAKVLRLVRKIQAQHESMVVLRGNHEELMLGALDGRPGMLRGWMRTGGRATLRSFGLEPPPSGDDPTEFLQLANATIPQELLQWMRNLPLSARSGSYFFCHAGIRPGVPIARQKRTDLLWIREDFLTDDRDHGAIIVHGHSEAATLDEQVNRIGVDTGAYRTGVLTALYLEGEERGYISTDPPAEEEPAA